MTEFELTESMQAMISNVWAAEAIYLSLVSGYVVVAYTIGARLTPYQHFFVNTLFILTVVTNSMTTFTSMQNIMYLAGQLAELADYYAAGVENPFAAVSIWLVYTIRILLTLGALIFMWTVRHPKA